MYYIFYLLPIIFSNILVNKKDIYILDTGVEKLIIVVLYENNRLDTKVLCHHYMIQSQRGVQLNCNNKLFAIKRIDGCLVVVTDEPCNWLDRLNYQSMINDYDLKKIILMVKNYCDKYHVETGDESKLYADKNFKFELRCINEAKRLDSYLDRTVRSNDHDFIAKRCAIALINDYMKCFRGLRYKLDGRYNMNLINDSLYNWSITIKNVKKLNGKDITIELTFLPTQYPSSPPTIMIKGPKFKDDLALRISRSKFTRSEYWNIDKTPLDIIVRICDIVKKHGLIASTNPDDQLKVTNNTKKLLETFNEQLYDTALLINETNVDDVIDIDVNKVKESSKIWDIRKYNYTITNRINKSVESVTLLVRILNEIMSNENNDIECTVEIFKKSFLFNSFLKSFKNISFLEIMQKSEYYKAIFILLQLYCSKNTMSLFHNPKKIEDSLYCCIEELNKKAQLCLTINQSNENAKMIANIYNTITPLYDEYCKSLTGTDLLPNSIDSNRIDLNLADDIYQSHMLKYKYFFCTGLHNDKEYKYKNMVEKEIKLEMKKCYKRMSNEIPSLIDSLSISEDSSVLVAIDKQKPNCLRFLITGPSDTPYARGIFIFDAYCDYRYPNAPPEIYLVNYPSWCDDDFNPFMYDDGAVCLSLLGSYIGSDPHESERWNPKISTLSQVIISIQSLIFVEHPYFNESGYEKSRGTPEGDLESKKYNNNVRVATVGEGMIDVIENIDKYSQFKEAIMTHFYVQRQKILKQCDEWINENVEELSEKCIKLKNILMGLDKLEVFKNSKITKN